MMRRSLATGLLLAATLSAETTHAQRPQDPDRDAVRAVIARFAEHVQAGDFGAIDSLFPQRGVHILTDTSTTHAWPEYRDNHLKPEMARYRELRYSHTVVEPVVRGDVAWVAFRREIHGTADGQTPVRGRGTAVLEKRDGRWLIVHLHMSR